MNRALIRLLAGGERGAGEKTRVKLGRAAGAVGIGTNFLLFCIKVFAGTVSHSIAITADAVNNLSDCVSSVITLVGFRLAAKPADQEHPFGHARFEYVSGLFVSILVFVVGFQFARDSFSKIFRPEQTEFSTVAVVILFVSVLVKLWQGSFYKAVGNSIHSDSLLATAADSRSDVLSTGVVLLGSLIARFTGYNLDGYLGIAVAALIMVTGCQLIHKATDTLLGEAPPKALVDDIYKTIKGYDGILGIHDLAVHNYGPGRCFASVHCEVPAERDILLSHDIIDNIEHDFLAEKGIHLVVHMDPIVTDNPKTNELKARVLALIRGISDEITIHDFRVVWGPTHANLVFDVCVPFGFRMDDAQLTQTVTDGIRQLNPSYYPVITVDHDYVPA